MGIDSGSKSLGIALDVLELVSLCGKAAEEIERLDDMLVEAVGHTETFEGTHCDVGVLYALRYCDRGQRRSFVDEFPALKTSFQVLEELGYELSCSSGSSSKGSKD